jgi:alpha-glucosidase
MNEPAHFRNRRTKTFPDDVRHDYDGNPAVIVKHTMSMACRWHALPIKESKNIETDKRPSNHHHDLPMQEHRDMLTWTGDNIAIMGTPLDRYHAMPETFYIGFFFCQVLISVVL